MPQLHLILTGRVQGVGMRYFALRTAQRLHVTGWVRNLLQGGVEIEAEGGREALLDFAAVLRRGPPGCEVDDCAETWRNEESGHREFRIVG
jgi:acylphosphatase